MPSVERRPTTRESHWLGIPAVSTGSMTLVLWAMAISRWSVEPFPWEGWLVFGSMTLSAILMQWGGTVVYDGRVLAFKWGPGRRRGAVELSKLTRVDEAGPRVFELELWDSDGGHVSIPWFPRLGRSTDSTNPRRWIWRTQSEWGPDVLAAAERNGVPVPPQVRHVLEGHGYWTYYLKKPDPGS